MANYYDWDGETRSSHNKKVKKSGRFQKYRRTGKRYGKYFTTKRGKFGRYVYINGRRVGFEEDPDSRARRRSRY